MSPWSGPCRIQPSRIFLCLFSSWISIHLPRQPSYPVFDQISISAVSIRLCLSPARLPMEPFPLGGQSCAEPAKTLSTIFYDLSDFCTRSAGQPITRLETLLILRLILTSSPSGFSLQPGISGQSGQRARVRGMQMTVSARNFFSSDCLIAGTGDP